MAKTTTGMATALVLTAIVAGALGWLFGSSSDGARVEELEAEIGRARRESRERFAELTALRARFRRESGEPAAAPAVESGAGGEFGPDTRDAAGDEEEEGETLDRAARLRRVEEIRAALPGYFEEAEGEKAIAALKELAALVPEGREAAQRLAVAINEDLMGPGKLKLTEMTFYGSLADPAIVELMHWSLENESLAAFRTMTAYSLPWTQPVDATVAEFTKALRAETDPTAQRAFVSNLARMRKPEATAALTEILLDLGRPAGLRAQIATEIADRDDEELGRRLETLALSDPEPEVREAAKAALVIRDPPRTGFMVTGTLPNSQAAAAGLAPGDILVSYGNRRVRDLAELREAAEAASEDEQVPITVVRDGREVTLHLRPGRMGVFGRDVKAR